MKDLEDTKKKLKSASELATVAATKLESVTAELSEAKGAQAMMSPSKVRVCEERMCVLDIDVHGTWP